MNAIAAYPSQVQGFSDQEASLGQSRYASVRQNSLAASETRSLGLTLTTREGDSVTLSSSSFVDFQAMTYDSRGRIQTGDSLELSRTSHRSLTLASGVEFTFSVN
jgi:hypothetical protein